MRSSPGSCATSWIVTWWCRASVGGFWRRPGGLRSPKPVREGSRPELSLDQATNEKTEPKGNRGYVENETQAHLRLQALV